MPKNMGNKMELTSKLIHSPYIQCLTLSLVLSFYQHLFL